MRTAATALSCGGGSRGSVSPHLHQQRLHLRRQKHRQRPQWGLRPPHHHCPRWVRRPRLRWVLRRPRLRARALHLRCHRFHRHRPSAQPPRSHSHPRRNCSELYESPNRTAAHTIVSSGATGSERSAHRDMPDPWICTSQLATPTNKAGTNSSPPHKPAVTPRGKRSTTDSKTAVISAHIP